MNDNFSIFGLTAEQSEVLFALQRKLTSNDVLVEGQKKPLVGSNKKMQKQLWLDTWDNSIKDYLKIYGGESSQTKLSFYDLAPKIKQLDQNAQNKVWKYMVFLECVLYFPYYPLSDNKDAYKPFKGLRIDKKGRKETLEQIADNLQIDKKYIKIFEEAHSSAVKKLSGYWTKVAMTAGAGIIVILLVILTKQVNLIKFFAAEGLKGAAATSSGLAALGGGAVAAGGFGTAGGISVLVGGGSLLGASAGTAVGLLIASLGSNAVLSEAAKLQVVLKEIVLAIQKDTLYFQTILLNINKEISQIKAEIIKLKTESSNNKKKIKDLEKSIEILEKLVKNA